VLLPVYQAQVLTYMRLTECPAGLLINFNVPRLMDGVKRLINARDSADRCTGEHGEGAHSTQATEVTKKMTDRMDTTETTD
jgi:PD-(D/E)XK nuclease superfamily